MDQDHRAKIRLYFSISKLKFNFLLLDPDPFETTSSLHKIQFGLYVATILVINYTFILHYIAAVLVHKSAPLLIL